MGQRVKNLAGVAFERDFVLLLTAQYGAQAADGIAQAAFATALLLEPSGAPGRILAVSALTLLPYSIIAPFTGVFVDRARRRNLMVWTNVARAGLMVGLPLWVSLFPGDALLYVAALALLGLGRLFLTTKGAALPAVLHERDLLRGNAISGGGGMISALLGGVAGLLVVESVGKRPAYVVAGLSYLAAASAARLISTDMAHPHPRTGRLREAAGRVARELVQGAGEVWMRERVRLALAGIFLLRTVGMFVVFAAILVIKREFGQVGESGERLSASVLALGAAGAGAFLGAVTAPIVGRRLPKAGLILAGFLVSSIGLVILGGIGTLTAVLGLTLLGGYGAFVAKIAVDAQVQEELPDEFRGRAFSLYDILYNLASVVAALLIVVFASTSLRLLFVVAGITNFVLALVIGSAMRRAGMFERSGPTPASSLRA